MPTELEKQIQELIKTNLPVAQAQAFTEFFEQHKKLVADHNLLNENYLKTCTELQTSSKDLLKAKQEINGMTADAERVKKLEIDLNIRERAIEERERKSDNEILKLQLQCEKEKVSLQASCLNTVFASPVYRNMISGNKTVPGNYGGAEMRNFFASEDTQVIPSHTHVVSPNGEIGNAIPR